LIAEIKNSIPPLKGVFHIAGLLKDGILLQQNWKNFIEVMEPKIIGTWNLHEFTKELPLDMFILFSSAASMLGAPAQGNYAAANAFMDAVAQYRKTLNLPALSINWGHWSEAGMAIKLDTHISRRVHERGMITPQQGIKILDNLIHLKDSQIGVLPIKWSNIKRQLPAGKLPPFLNELAEEFELSEIKSDPSLTKKSDIYINWKMNFQVNIIDY
jgi:hypothetical protein